MCGTFKTAEMRLAYVPLPTPGGPRNTHLICPLLLELQAAAAAKQRHALCNEALAARIRVWRVCMLDYYVLVTKLNSGDTLASSGIHQL